MKKIMALILCVVAALSLAACGKETEEGKIKIGLICLHDENSTYDKNFIDAMKEMQKELGLSDDQIIYKTNVDESNVCYEACKDLVDRGCSIIIADSFGHEDYLIQAAKQFKDVQFCHATGTKAHTEKLANFHNAFANIYEGRYAAGVAAGLKLNEMIESGKITADQAVMGYVGAFTYAEVISGYTSFYLGAKSVCPSVTMKVQFTGSWYNEGFEKEAANALINQGCVLISQHADSMGAPTACETAGVPNVSYNGSTVSACPNTFIVSSRINWAKYYAYVYNCVKDGKEIAVDWTGGFSEGSVELSAINEKAAAPGTKEKVDAVVADLKAGKIKVFDINTFTVDGGKKLESYMADVDTDKDFTPDTEVVSDGYFHESEKRSAPAFDIKTVDGITLLNVNFGE
ncbi:MAG: BMP family ABC transporter substrate-binding protein [Lachnospiraceae bacterium]|nr:BMP family ABC transporter substrate-binding protein [Lachnospiraceae bacterium]